MMKEERDHVFNKLLEAYGERPQVDMMIEEMSELTKALLKMRRADENSMPALKAAVIDELADVRIMVRQMELLYQCADDVECRIDYKIDRQKKRLGEKK